LAGSGIDRKTFWNVVAVAGLLIIVLAIGVFVVKTMGINGNPGPSVGPTATPGPASVTAYPSLVTTPTPTVAVNVTITPTPTATITPTSAPYSTPTPTPTPTAAPTLTPTPAPTFYPTQPPQATPTATPLPADVLPDEPFFESITPLKPGDNLPPVYAENSYDGNGPVFIDFSNSYLGSDWAYPGDTVGVKLRLYNNGPALDKVAKVTMTMAKMYITQDGQVIWISYPLNKQFNTRIVLSDHGSTIKNLSYMVPTDLGDLKGTYKIYIKFYLGDQYSAGVVKVLNIM
jgi:hypothetical protein